MNKQDTRTLEKGRIPARIMLAEIRAYYVQHDEGQEILALRAGMPVDTLCSWLGQPERFATFSFDLCDRLFGAMGITHLWSEKYAEFYDAVNLEPRPHVCQHGVDYEDALLRDLCAKCRANQDQGNRRKHTARKAAK